MKPNSTALLAATLLVSACASAPNSEEGPPVRATARYELAAREATSDVLLAVRDDGLSQAQRQALAEVALAPGRGEVTLVSGAAARDQAHVAAAKRFLEEVGVRDVRVRVLDGADREPVVRVSYARLEAVRHDCDAFWGDMTKTKANHTHLNLGCAVTSNMALQVADPNDLRRPQAETPADSARRATVMDRYRKGEPTGATIDGKDSARIAKTVQ